MAARNQGQGGFGFVDLILIEMHGLVETITAGRLEIGLLELLDGIGLSFLKTFAAGVAAFEGIIGEEFDVRPPGVAIEVGSGWRLLGWGSDSRGEEKNPRQSLAHEFLR